ncbi:Exonuclease [Cynara cardunculus var. scolymus]|uniref:Exonuclease n=1 Tax=Cynara cardunculus var. scolymus TaxID=59895 RepID=A0A103XNV6_CYNCS|nr:Exonuclease [Cynara cardunculus var. scolymus]
MNELPNAFSLLELDVEDDNQQVASAANSTEETNGLNVQVDRILEIACGPDLVIHQPKDCLDKMGEWCQDHHAASGLTEKVIQSTVSEKEAEEQVIDFVKRHVSAYTPLLAGNSIYIDFISTCRIWRVFSRMLWLMSAVSRLYVGSDKKNAPKKEKKHRAMDDIRESIAELKYYKEHVFKSPES